MSNHYSSINRAWLRPAILRKASRHLLRTRTWTMTRFVLCWLPHCTSRSERQMRNELQVYHSVRENLMSSSSQDPLSTERPGALCKYSQLHMRYIQSLTHPSTHVKRERTERKTSRLQAQQQPHQEGLASLPQGHPGPWGTPVGPGRTPTVHRCLHGGRPWVARRNLHEDDQRQQTTGHRQASRQTCLQRSGIEKREQSYC